MAIGLDPLATPTARDAPTPAPSRAAISPYEAVAPYGIRVSSDQTRCWN